MRADRRRLLAGGVALLAGAAAGVGVLAQAKERVIPVVARKFVFLPSVIQLKKGEPVVMKPSGGWWRIWEQRAARSSVATPEMYAAVWVCWLNTGLSAPSARMQST